ncbi:DUF1149 family protein [Streptococcus oriscaviae]|uniref:DUF1149 family protein n=1 Tax=Streptococcus oriscaviae TaxID=2781599 RepID=A0ABX7YMW2_9STRE|nr:DUF1149 family protein [Streptococcus oriscaviae]QUE54564.1 DUF1149 family protein [Streptococcus oriscaviae]
MDIIRDKEFVNQYHFDARNLEWEKENGTPTTQMKVDFQLIEKNRDENRTSMVTILRFMIVLEYHVISGAMSQSVHLKNCYIEEPSEFSAEDKRILVEPLLEMLKRMTYDVTEIAFDAPGVNLEF